MDLPRLTQEHPLRADPAAQQQLLDLQLLDSRLDQLRHRAAHLPETAQLAVRTEERARLDGEARDLQVQVDDLTREQRKADSDVEQVRLRRTRDQERLDSGAVGNPKDLERLQHELISLQRRITELEDLELEVMARLEDAQLDLDRRRNDIALLDAEVETLTAARGESLERLREEAGRIKSDRAALVGGLPDDLLALYERLREQKDGVGAALLRARRCGGCSLELNSAELADIAKMPADEVVRCDECGRILVRTAESGL